MKPIIGIIARPVMTMEKNFVYAAYEKIRLKIIEGGGIPIAIMPTDLKTYSLDLEDKEELEEYAKEDLKKVLDLCDGFILQGGSKWYKYDEFILSYLIEKDIPTLAICLSMQLLVFLDTKENPLLVNDKKHQEKDLKYAHALKIFKDTLLYKILKKEKIKVNSRHQHIVKKVNNLKVEGVAGSVIEAVTYPNKKFILGSFFL